MLYVKTTLAMNPRDGLVWMLALFFLVACSFHLTQSSRSESRLRIGKSINVLVHYGYLDISMRVIPNNSSYETEKWLFKVPTRDIYKNITNITQSRETDTPGIYHDDFHIELCDNRRQLLQAYFRDFTIENLNKPWEAFTGGWFADSAAKKLGINTSFIQGDYSYVLVRVVRFREIGEFKVNISDQQPLLDDVRTRMESLEVGDVISAMQFMESFGTHYINSYKTGNSLYQVFVYNSKNYQMIKEQIKTKGINGLSKEDLYNFFAPTNAEHMGTIRSASANATVERWARRNLQYEYYDVKYVTLLKLHGNRTLLRALDNILGNDAILQMDLKSLKIIFQNEPEKQNWLLDVLDRVSITVPKLF